MGILTPEFAVVYSHEEAIAAAERLGYPVALKIIATGLVHKTEAGGVFLNAGDPAAVARAVDSLERSAVRPEIELQSSGILVERMVEPGVEVIVGVRRDPVLGPFLILGAGGRLADLLGPPVIHTLPVDLEIACAMVRAAKVFPLLRGYRGEEPYDTEALIDLMVKLSAACLTPCATADEIELNPVIVCPQARGAFAVDAYGYRSAAAARPETQPGATDPDPALRALLHPASVAIVGASANPLKFSNWLLRYLQQYGYRGRLYPVNPHQQEICGLACYPSIASLPEAVDVACLVVPAHDSPETVRACAARGVKAGIVYASGFRETGSGELEEALMEAGREGGMRLCGPNTIGLVRPGDAICLTFSNSVADGCMRDGPVAVISQSGAIGGSLVARLWAEEIGTSFWISAGNESDLDVADYIRYASEDARTRVVAVFLEGIKHGQRFRDAVDRCVRAGKPVVVYKSGASAAGRSAVETHTGKLAGDAALYAAYFRDLGAIEAGEWTEALDIVRALVFDTLPRGSAVASLSPSGGAGSIVADECAAAGLHMAQLATESRQRLLAWIGAGGNADNPVDVGGLAFVKPEVFRLVLETLIEDNGVDGVILPFTTISEKFAAGLTDHLLDLPAEPGKPVLAAWLGAPSQARDSYARLRTRFPMYDSVRGAVRAMRALVRWQQVKSGCAAGLSRGRE